MKNFQVQIKERKVVITRPRDYITLLDNGIEVGIPFTIFREIFNWCRDNEVNLPFYVDSNNIEINFDTEEDKMKFLICYNDMY